MVKQKFLKAGSDVIAVDSVLHADFSQIEKLEVKIVTSFGEYVAKDIDAIEAAMTLKPSTLEGKRLKWAKHIWAIHNLVGHPLMQVLAFFKQYGLAMWVHDVTVPKPIDAHDKRLMPIKWGNYSTLARVKQL